MKKNKILSSAKKTLSIEQRGIKTLSHVFNNNFYNAVKTIFNTKGRVIVTGVGKSAHIGNKIAATLSSTGTPSFFVHATEASHGDLGTIKKNDCIIAISNSGETLELSNIINYSKRFNIPLISITGNSKSSLHKKSTYGILYKKPIEAPVIAGQEYGKLIINIENKPKIIIPLVAEKSIGKINPIYKIFAVIKYLLFGTSLDENK